MGDYEIAALNQRISPVDAGDTPLEVFATDHATEGNFEIHSKTTCLCKLITTIH
ncbi:MAG: hypothetical protein IPP41_03165 [Rhodocyclaceae bacterium]|nr:hypothetical protein [Rhodocyclaceae bacterium]